MSTFPGRFAGKVGVVTGAAQGIGKAVALRLAAEGGAVALVDRSPSSDEVRAEIEAQAGVRISRSQLSKALRKKSSAGGGLGTR